MSATACGLGVETVEEYQRRGIATILAAAALETARARNLRPYWDAWTGNTPSICVAQKVGLTPVSEYTATVGSWEQD
jgi:GNAT superfamily N-acetyltransferase